MKSFKGSSGGESPARSAVTLISDCSNSLTSPIDGVWQIGLNVKLGVAFVGNTDLSLSVVNGLEFECIHVGKLVEGNFEGLFAGGMSGIVGLDEKVVFSELEESVGFFFLFSVISGVLKHPVFEGDVDFGLISGNEGAGWD